MRGETPNPINTVLIAALAQIKARGLATPPFSLAIAGGSGGQEALAGGGSGVARSRPEGLSTDPCASFWDVPRRLKVIDHLLLPAVWFALELVCYLYYLGSFLSLVFFLLITIAALSYLKALLSNSLGNDKGYHQRL